MKRRIDHLVVKIAERCNLNCSYCYMYNHEDKSYLRRPRYMSDEIFDSMLERARRYCLARPGLRMGIIFHGGEPLLAGRARVQRFVERTRAVLGEMLDGIGLQTNATLIDERWATLLKHMNVKVGVSLDGDAVNHDRYRKDLRGRGSHAAAVRGLERLQSAGALGGVIAVVDPDGDGRATYRYFRSLGVRKMNFLFPDVSHDNKRRLYGQYGSTPIGDFLIQVFDEWYREDDPEIELKVFSSLLSAMLGGKAGTEAFGNPLLSFLVIETDGGIHANDALRVCEEDIGESGLSVVHHDFDDLRIGMPLVYRLAEEGIPLCATCGACPEVYVCGGGNLAHRFSRANGFNNESVWCADILKLIGHMRHSTAIHATP
jgi:uncharacterized protein